MIWADLDSVASLSFVGMDNRELLKFKMYMLRFLFKIDILSISTLLLMEVLPNILVSLITLVKISQNHLKMHRRMFS